MLLAYLDEHDDARKMQSLVAAQGQRCVTLAGDLGNEPFLKGCGGCGEGAFWPHRHPGQQCCRAAPPKNALPRSHASNWRGPFAPHFSR